MEATPAKDAKENSLASPREVKRVIVDRNLCIGAGSCVVAAPTVFELNGENKAVIKQQGGVKNSGPAEKEVLEDQAIPYETLLAAAQSCPTKAIIVVDEQGTQIYP